MGSDLSKTVIRVIQDYCFRISATTFCDRFVLFLTKKICLHIENGTLTLSILLSCAKGRNDFFVANDLDAATFCEKLFLELNKELSFYIPTSFIDTLLEYKRKMENGAFRGFPREKTSEETLRSNLYVYLREETFCEPRAAAGNCDIVVPSQKVVIETKLWGGQEYYNSGIPELEEYLKKYNYEEGYYIIFDYNQTLNEVIQNEGQIFDFTSNGLLIHCIFIRMNEVRPSKKYQHMKKNL